MPPAAPGPTGGPSSSRQVSERDGISALSDHPGSRLSEITGKSPTPKPQGRRQSTRRLSIRSEVVFEQQLVEAQRKEAIEARAAALAAKEYASKKKREEAEKQRAGQVEKAKRDADLAFRRNKEKELADRLAREREAKERFRRLAKEARTKIETMNQRELEEARQAALQLKEEKLRAHEAQVAKAERQRAMRDVQADNERRAQLDARQSHHYVQQRETAEELNAIAESKRQFADTRGVVKGTLGGEARYKKWLKHITAGAPVPRQYVEAAPTVAGVLK